MKPLILFMRHKRSRVTCKPATTAAALCPIGAGLNAKVKGPKKLK